MARHRAQRYARSRRRPTLSWTSFAAGIVCGGLLTFVGALLPGLFGAKNGAESAPSATKVAATAPTRAIPKFEFFDSLPKSRVSAPARPDSTAAPPSSNARRDVEYLLQAGSFSNREDADRLRASVASWGFTAETSSALLADGVERFRVLVGPYSGDQELRRAMGKLREQNLDPLPIARKPGAG